MFRVSLKVHSKIKMRDRSLPQVKVIDAFDGGVMFVHLRGQLGLELLCFLQIRVKLLFLPELQIHTLTSSHVYMKAQKPTHLFMPLIVDTLLF